MLPDCMTCVAPWRFGPLRSRSNVPLAASLPSGRTRRGFGSKMKTLVEVPSQRIHLVSRFGLAVRLWAGKQKGPGSIPLRLSLLFKKVVVCRHFLIDTVLWLGPSQLMKR